MNLLMNNTMSQNIQHNSDFLFIYEAAGCNPNGDPDQENKPRMDYDTHTNLVTDVRIKRYIRDYLLTQGKEIFVDMVSDAKVSMDSRLKEILLSLFSEDEKVQSLLNDNEMYARYQKAKENTPEKTRQKFIDKKKYDKELNLAILGALVRQRFIDIRMFGSAFAIEGFNRALTGPVQMNWAYSLNQVFLMDSNTIASIMSSSDKNEGNSNFGKDYRVKYSLLATHGSVNQHAAQTTGLTNDDLQLFRDALWSSISASPTRSKLNQYPRLYLEIVYNPGFYNGYFGDLRNLLTVSVKNQGDPRTVQRLSDLEIHAEKLEKLSEHRGEGKPIREIIIRQSADPIIHLR
ncbi:MAG: type I-B CRISPR-associated protein Cas7/Csh2 [Bacteroidia bacterium]